MPLTNDPLVESQWYLSNLGQRGAPGYDLNLAPIWGRYGGRGLVIAVNDDGVDLQHSDLAANLLVDLAYDAGRNTLGQGFVGADNSHGTVVASIIGMVANNGIGGTGIAWGAKIAPTFTANPTEGPALVFLANLQAKAAVSVNSWGSDPAFAENFGASGLEADRLWGDALQLAATEGRNGLGMVIEVSGGNERDNRADTALSNWTGNKFTIAVASMAHDGSPAPYSTRGASLLVTAPGGVASEEDMALDRGFGIASADLSGTGGYNTAAGAAGDYVFQNQGTSYSGPMVAAIAALMIEANPTLGFRDVSNILALTARKTDATNDSWVQQQGREWNLGGMHFSRDFGYGLVDAAAAVRLAESWTGGTNTVANWLSAEGVSTAPARTVAESPAGNPGLQVTATVTQAVTIERLEVAIDLAMNAPSQLGALLTSPSGTTHVLFDRPLTQALQAPPEGGPKVPSGPENPWPDLFTLGLTAFMGESSQGTWQLQLFDTVTGEVATFYSFTVRAWGKAPGPDNQYVFTDEYSGTHTLSDAGGIDTLNAAAVSRPVTLVLTPAGGGELPAGTFSFAAGTVVEHAIGGAGDDRLAGNTLANILFGNEGNDVILGGPGNDTMDGGLGAFDVVDFFGTQAVNANLQAGTATQGSDSDTISGFEAIFGSAAADTLRGRDSAENVRGDTMRGGAGNDTIDGGGGYDTAEFSGARANYTVTRAGAGAAEVTVVDTVGTDGTDRTTSIERFIFADQLIAFGSRAEDVARVAFVLWTPEIISSTWLFARGLSFYDVGYDFNVMCQVALQFHPATGQAFAQQLVAGTPGTTRSVADVLALMNAAGGGDAGRAAAVAAMAQDPATTANLAAKGVFISGINAALEVPGFGTLFGPLPGG